MLRTGKASALRREAPPVAEDTSISPRDFVRAGRRINRETGQLSLRSLIFHSVGLRSRALHSAKLAGLTGKTKLV